MKNYIAIATLFYGMNLYAVALPVSAESALIDTDTQQELSTSGMTKTAGRVLTLFTHPVTSNKLWAGTAHGGLWFSSDKGQTWSVASDALKAGAVSAIAIAPLNPDIMYVGTGDGRSNDEALRGIGMYRTSDGGTTWELLPLTHPAKVGESWRHINHIAINANGVILAATSDDQFNGYIYRSSNGGQTWGILPVYIGNRIGPKNVIHTIKFDPDKPDNAIFMDNYANVTHSTDAGVSWKIIKKSSTCQ